MRDDVDTEVSLQTGALVCVISFRLFALSLVSSADLSSPLSEMMQLSAADTARRAGVVGTTGRPPLILYALAAFFSLLAPFPLLSSPCTSVSFNHLTPFQPHPHQWAGGMHFNPEGTV